MIEMVKASAQDAMLLAKTRKTVWAENYRGIFPDRMLDDYCPESYAMLDRQKLDSKEHHYYLFLDGEECVGYFSFGPSNFGAYKDFDLCLNNLYIREGYKGIGLGRQAFSVLWQYCAENNIRKFFCGCNVHNLPAQAFYRHMGGIQADEAKSDVPREDQIIHFEFYTGD